MKLPFIPFIRRFSRKRLGIDLGTANSLVYLSGSGIVLNEPTVVAVSIDDNRVVAIGRDAREMLGRTPETIIASRPLRDGVIADYVVTEAMLRFFINRVCGRSRLLQPDVMVCVPVGITSVERRAVVDATMSAGVRRAYLIDEPLAAAIGAQVPIGEPSGNMVVDIGGGSTEIAVISLGGVVAHASVRVAGNRIDEAIASFIRRTHNLLISDRMAEEIKITIGNAFIPAGRDRTPDAMHRTRMHVRGRDTVTGLPRTAVITEAEVNTAMQEPSRSIVGGIKHVLEHIPPELSSDIIDKGVIMSGGSALLRNLDALLTEEIGVPFHVAENPLTCVAIGTGKAIEGLNDYSRSVRQR